ncbi:putative bifunctional diguanylate cyclase/phosphodiesterase, partial [Pseudomonadota bacterium]
MNHTFSLFDHIQSPIWVFDLDCKKIIWANKTSLPLWEACSLEELTARDFSLDMSEAVEATLNGYRQRFINGEAIKTWWNFTPKQILKKALCTFSGMTLPDGRVVMLVEVIAEESSMRRDLAFSDCSNLALLFCEQGDLISTNNSFSHSFGEYLQDLANFLGDIELARTWIKEARQQGSISHKKLCWTGQSHLWFDIEGQWLQDKQQLLLHLINISPEKEILKQAKHDAKHDFLTGLFNRHGISNVIKESHHSHQPYGLLFLDIDGFKLVNDTYGHAIGDKLLRAIAVRLTETLQHKGLLARFGGDEFIIQVEHRNVQNTPLFAKKIITELNKPFHLKEVGELSIGCSIGIASYPEDAQDIETLITQADMAMHRAKLRGRNRSHHFSQDMADALYRKMTLRHHLTLALEAEAFELYYQPIVDLKVRKLKGFEALIRWYDEELGQVSPAEFIPLAEETGQIVPLG